MSSSDPEPTKQTEWKKLYEAAVLELDRTALPDRVQAARAAIHSRIVELKTARGAEDESRLEDALRILEWLTKTYD